MKLLTIHSNAHGDVLNPSSATGFRVEDDAGRWLELKHNGRTFFIRTKGAGWASLEYITDLLCSEFVGATAKVRDCLCQKYEGRDCRKCFRPPYPDQQGQAVCECPHQDMNEPPEHHNPHCPGRKQGQAVMPEQPTQEMVDAFRKAHDEHAALRIPKVYARGQREEQNIIVGYRAMREALLLQQAENAHPNYVTITSGMRGMFPVMMAWNKDMGTYEPAFTGETCKNHAQAIRYGRALAEAEGVEFRP